MLVEKIEKGAKDIVFVYTTCHDWAEARAIGLAAIEKKLAVCADFWEVNSVYPWHGVIQEVGQYMCMITTQEEFSDALIKFVGGMHSYTTPMIARLDTALINPTYKFWAEDTIQNKDPYISEHEAIVNQETEEDGGYHFGKLK